ncbi:hypothetical protein COO60DRAFT_1565725 [Scenedesmus sp. NREL 46B-D3]|nr:hypothetical protein COO60DRAFT_1565725 [Scenedesmus sp. NREL 46B-D3]
MAWGQSNKPPEPDADAAGRSRFAAPPTCPRCELTKSQMNRTIQNYQKAYRKKVEGLKQELSTVRADNTHLRSQVRRLRRKRLLHAPSLVLGAAAGFLVTKLVQRLRRQRQQQQQQLVGDEKAAEQQQEQQQQQPAAEQVTKEA